MIRSVFHIYVLHFVMFLLLVEVCSLASYTADDALIREEALDLLSEGRYILRDGECPCPSEHHVMAKRTPTSCTAASMYQSVYSRLVIGQRPPAATPSKYVNDDFGILFFIHTLLGMILVPAIGRQIARVHRGRCWRITCRCMDDVGGSRRISQMDGGTP